MLGLSPRQHSSGRKERLERVTKAGQRTSGAYSPLAQCRD
ncbi:transposase [Salipiger pacificus]|nr:transposase [Alloyangia pacifica]